MRNLVLNSAEFIKSQLYVSQDGMRAHLHHEDVGGDQAYFLEAVDYIVSIGWDLCGSHGDIAEFRKRKEVQND